MDRARFLRKRAAKSAGFTKYNMKNIQHQPKRRSRLLGSLILLGIGFACGLWHAEILEQVARGVEIARGW